MGLEAPTRSEVRTRGREGGGRALSSPAQPRGQGQVTLSGWDAGCSSKLGWERGRSPPPLSPGWSWWGSGWGTPGKEVPGRCGRQGLAHAWSCPWPSGHTQDPGSVWDHLLHPFHIRWVGVGSPWLLSHTQTHTHTRAWVPGVYTRHRSGQAWTRKITQHT